MGHFFQRYENTLIVSVHFDDLLFALQLSTKSFPKPLFVSIRYKNKKKRMLSAEYFYNSYNAFSRCNAIVSLLKDSNIIILLRLFSVLVNQFPVVFCGLIYLAKLVDRFRGDGQENLCS